MKKVALLDEDTKTALQEDLSHSNSWKLYNGLKNSTSQNFNAKFNCEYKAPSF